MPYIFAILYRSACNLNGQFKVVSNKHLSSTDMSFNFCTLSDINPFQLECIFRIIAALMN